MLRIAREMNLSETAFVQPQGQYNSYKTASTFLLRWFTPTTEVALCGHATLATAHVLFHELGLNTPSITFETMSGNLVVERSHVEAHKLRMNFPLGKPQMVSLPPHTLLALLAALKLKEDDLTRLHPPHPEASIEACPPVILFCPITKKLFVEIDSVDRLKEVKPSSAELLAIEWPDGLLVRGVSVMTQGGAQDKRRRRHLRLRESETAHGTSFPDFGRYDFISRYFSPWNGIEEDPVNGSSHTALVVYWAEQLGKGQLRAYQASMRGGEIELELRDDISRVVLQGVAFTVMGGRLRIY
jgi:predicted PhzF superfamily epimerase YddE/YHI9